MLLLCCNLITKKRKKIFIEASLIPNNYQKMLLNPTPCLYSSIFYDTTVRYYISENLLIIPDIYYFVDVAFHRNIQIRGPYCKNFTKFDLKFMDDNLSFMLYLGAKIILENEKENKVKNSFIRIRKKITKEEMRFMENYRRTISLDDGFTGSIGFWKFNNMENEVVKNLGCTLSSHQTAYTWAIFKIASIKYLENLHKKILIKLSFDTTGLVFEYLGIAWVPLQNERRF